MKIAMIGHKDYPSRSGGVEVVVYELASRLSRNGHDVTVYNRVHEEKEKSYDTAGVKAKYIFAPKKEGLNALIGSFTATLSAIFGGYDIIHYHAIGPSVPIFIPHLLGKKTVATVHGLNWRCAKWGKFASMYLKFGEKMAAKFADEVVVLSEEMQKYFKDTYNRETTLIKNAVVPIEQTPCDIITKKFNLKKDDYILFLARVTPEKGLQYLISAYKQSKLDKKLVIAGDLPDSDYCREIKDMAKDCENIIFTGFANLNLVQELYSNCAVYVLPSETEGLALTLIEAMACGARCVTSDIPENTVVLKDFGKFFVSKDVNSLANALVEMVNEPFDAQKMSRQMEYIKNDYSYDRFYREYLNLYKKVLGE